MTTLDNHNRHVILCDGATLPAELVGKVPDNHVWPLVQRKGKGEVNLVVQIQDFITPLLAHVPDKAKDLLEIAAFIYGADRLISRGETSQVEYLKWARDFVFCIPVRELVFWQQSRIQKSLVELLVFISGDRSYQFYFEQRTGGDAPASLFDVPQSNQKSFNVSDCKIALFSGGLDSLSGVIELLEQTSGKVVVTSHRSGPSTPVQKRVFEALQNAYPNRLIYHPLKCNLSKKRPPEETQRTRFFLYTTVGYVLAQAYGQDSLHIYENGVTSINLRRRQDLINARASRTTHPKTISLLNNFFSEVKGEIFTVQHPFLFLTKQILSKR